MSRIAEGSRAEVQKRKDEAAVGRGEQIKYEG